MQMLFMQLQRDQMMTGELFLLQKILLILTLKLVHFLPQSTCATELSDQNFHLVVDLSIIHMNLFARLVS